MKQQRRYSGYEPLHSNPNFKMKYPEFSAYNPEGSIVHNSPCMSRYWRDQNNRSEKNKGG
ncbi:hypothetical protein MTHERMMSTA1_13390 [Methanosarcina thermophila MST-A1]|nr:hypothetical protein MTHERMMSTA1_13390 [Methanosarcina thermophila MST-A1]